MAWIKDLGKVKGENGDIYTPNIETNKNKATIKWNKQLDADSSDSLEQSFIIPVYVPTYDKTEGKLIFELNTSGTLDVDTYTLPLLKVQETINNGFELRPFTGDPNNIENKEPGVFYIEDTDNDNYRVYIYDTSKNKMVAIEGLAFDDFDNYYTKDQIDEKMGSIAEQQEYISEMLGIPYVEEVSTNNG